MTVTVRPATLADAEALQLRPSDLHEAALWVPGWSPLEVLRNSVEHSHECLAGVEEGRVVALAGYRVDGQEVYPWLMCSDLAPRHRKLLLRLARAFLSKLRDAFPAHVICNHVNRDNAQARAFINHLGFRVVRTPGNAEFDFFYLPCASQPYQ